MFFAFDCSLFAVRVLLRLLFIARITTTTTTTHDQCRLRLHQRGHTYASYRGADKEAPHCLLRWHMDG
jgi:hypothetical protein